MSTSQGMARKASNHHNDDPYGLKLLAGLLGDTSDAVIPLDLPYDDDDELEDAA
jgi:hypothetical protein